MATGWSIRPSTSFWTELYVYRGTNDYNFEKLIDPPTFEPTLCSQCGKRINLGEGGWSYGRGEFCCIDCVTPDARELMLGNWPRAGERKS